MESVAPVEVPADRSQRVRSPLPARLFLRRAALLFVAVLGLFEGYFAARVIVLRRHNPSVTAFMSSRMHEARSRGTELSVDQRWVEYRDISPDLKRAVLAAEDPTFFRHRGFDWVAIRKAAAANLSAGRITSGGSTITQQLAKNVFLGGSRSYPRKAQEAIITVLMEALVDKERLLELYLNVVEWGDGVFGVEAAAQKHFGVHAADLNVAQAAILAAMLPNPRYYERNIESARLARSSNRIFRAMSRVTTLR